MYSRLVAFVLSVVVTIATMHPINAEEVLPNLTYGSWGFDSNGADFSIRPGDDFFRYANGRWLDETAIASDQSRATLRAYMTDNTEARLHSLLEAAALAAGHSPSDIKGKVGAFYKSFMDENTIEALGPKPVFPTIATIQQMSDRGALGAMMGRALYDFTGTFFNLSIDVDRKDPTHYAVHLEQGGLGLPDRTYYTSSDSEFRDVKDAYLAYVEKLLALVGWPDPAGNAAQIVAMETKIAAAQWSKSESRIIEKTYNPVSIEELEALAPGFPWRAYLAEARLSSVSRVIVAEKSAFPKIAEIFSTSALDTLRAWQAFNVTSMEARYLSKPFSDAYFEMYQKTLLGQEKQKERWKRGVVAVSGDLDGGADPIGHLGWAVGQLYGEAHFSPAMKGQVEIVVRNLVQAYRDRLEKNDWMNPATKAEALAKLDSLIVLVGYPNVLQRSYSDLIVRDDDIIGNVRRAAKLDWDFYLNRLPNPVERAEWYFKPQVNNAVNLFYLRTLNFPAALFQAPMYDPNADPAINYGAFGAYAGHEITHAFDDQGRKIDAGGALRDWWLGDESSVFEARATRLGTQYSAFEPLPGLHVDGRLTMGENIADLGGLTLALDAYHSTLQGKPSPIIDGLTGDQRVFLGWAQAWRGKLTDSALRNQLASDPHAPRQYRVNGVVRNIDAWYAAFGAKPESKLYVRPEDRVRIW
jgi:putative endopeptidase